ncbi:uncharacterized protein LOC119732831 [Patiria miniata]|uniref:Uncharacterized protein n=1 Tax=Patiria miniata TaxID=46514 RepID=A0A914AEJ4_PATMI|nr:uncharacterized protein LOC119732831 [Patiria miniata]
MVRLFDSTASPSLTVPSVSDQVTDDGQSTASVSWPTITAINSDGQPITCLDSLEGEVSLTGGMFGIGSHTVTCWVTNLAGCTVLISFTFTVRDNEHPIVTCPENIERCTMTNDVAVYWPTQPMAIDNVDGYISVTCRNQNSNVVTSGEVYAIGKTTVTCTAQDSALNQGMCTFTITVIASPSLTVPSVSDQVTDGGQSTASVSWPRITAINSDGQPITCIDSLEGEVSLTGGMFGIGSHTVTCWVTNLAGCTVLISFTFTVRDNEHPIVICPENIERCTMTNDVAVNWPIQPWAIDNVDGYISVTCRNQNSNVVTSGEVYAIGKTTVTCTAQDSAWNQGMCAFTITVIASPSLTVPSVSDQVTDGGQSTASVSWPRITAINSDGQPITCIDSLEGEVSLTGGMFGVGSHIVTCWVTNLAGCTDLISFTFTVRDNAHPIVICPENIERCTMTNDVAVNWPIQPWAIDNVDGYISVTCRNQNSNVVTSGEVYAIGETTVTCTAQDSAWNQGMCAFTITVIASSLVPFGVGDSALSSVSQPFFLPSKDRISPTFTSRQFFPFGNELYEFVYFTDNGVIILSNNRRVRRTIYKQAFPSTFSFSFNGNVQMIAPFWADVRADAFDSTNNVFWQLYDNPSTDSTMLRTLSNIVSAQYGSFLANWVLVITWSNVHTQFETNTFQAILLTNGEHSYVIFNYDPCGMNWDPASLFNHYVIQGFTCGRFGRKVYVDLLGRSVFRPGSVVGNSGMIGRWVYQLDTLQANFINPRLFCYNWYYRQRSSYIFFLYLYPVRVANTCPCSLQSARRDRRWVPIPYSYVLPTQFSLRFDQGVLVRYYCCEQSSLCRLYRRWRPIQSCRRYRPPRRGWNFGDPHMRTLDGLDYTFNGLGEYTMALIDDDDGQRQFELQGRTQRALNSETQQLSEATFFAGFAAEYVGDARIEIKLNSDGTDLETKVNGASVTPTADGLLIGNFTVLREEDPIKIIAVYQADIQFSVGVSNSFADITTQLSEDYMNKTKGLLGVWDGDKGNDALRRDNTQQTVTGPNGEQSEQDFFAFGQTWAISESDSLFYYVPPGESFSNINDPSFTPKFLDNLTSEADPAKLQAAQDACGNNEVCLYDALATGSTEIGVASMQLSEQNTIDMMAATNFPPNVTLVETVEVVVGQPFILQIQAVDPDGDDISYELLEVIPGATVSSPGGQFTWTPADRSKVTLGFLVTDGKANATLEPIVKLCDCKNAGTCLYDEYVEGTNVITDGRFGVVLCNCTPGWSGDFCEMNYDACQDNPCFLGVACFDDDPPSLNFTCGSCPEGTEGDGKSCIDIDECVVYRDEPASNNGRGCDQNCVNTLASFNCSCNSGYSLFVDGKRCIDINECDSQTDDCADDATCNNTQGSYECSCNTGFNGDGTSCQDINECIGTNDCDNGAECANTIGSYRCQCRQGYEGSGFTCTDVNECSRNTDECNIQAMCDNTEGSYTCTCNEGLSGDGRNCTNVNECEGSTPVCHENATCTDIPGSFNCRCNAGFNGNGTDCQDIDECDLEIDNCLQNCRNTIGSFECVCHEAFTLLDGSCVANTNCSENSICVNGDCYVNGADIERCLCYRGYQNASDPMVCEDINECNATESYCGPSSTCNNTAGGFECLCSEGFRQGNDQRDCLDIDECTLPVDDPLYPVCIATAKCYNNHGTYDCRCKSGYEGNGTHCQNIDECQSGHLCVANSTCLDNAGSYTCHCNTGFHGDGRVLCMNIDECLEDPDMCHSLATCSDTEGSYQCNCDSGYQGNGTYCEDVDECMTESHDCASGRAHCVNNDGSYTCTCMNGYVSAPGMLPGRQCDDIDECSLNLDSCDPSVSQCNNTDDGSYICNCLLGFVKDDMNQCIDMNECEDPAACVSRANTECVNLHGSYDCPCRMGFYLQNSECLSGVSYNASAVFNIISGDLVGGNGFNLVTNYLKYRTELKDAIEAAFRSSDLSDNLGDVVISEISLLTDSTALLRLVINLNMSQPEQTIIQPFLSQLTGSSGGQLAPDHRLVGSTFIIGDPKCNSSPCTNGGTCADDNSVLPEGYTCTCLPGYSGKNCEIAPCGNNPCMNDGTCRVVSTTMTGYMCECALGYSGPQCQMIVPCELSNDCMNAATCVNEFVNARGYTCMCGDGFMGENCENECSLTCMNGGTRDPATCQCVCSPPWTGDTCTECSLTCINGGTTDPATCQCVCSPPWTGDTCTECPLTTASCLNGGTLDEEYCECVCPLTHSGDLCQDSNVCLTSDRCSDNTTGHYCVPSNTAFTCECRTYDAYFMEGAACENRRRFALTVVITLLTETYRSVYINPWSSAFRAKAALYKRLVSCCFQWVERRLREDQVTNDVISADCVSIQNGSVVATMVLRYPAAPSTTDVHRVLLENRPLTDGDVAITTDPLALRVNEVTDCPPDYCQNGAMCMKSGYYVSMFTYTCSCGSSFTGERCETVIPVPTDVPTATTESPGGLSTEVIVIIIVACVVLFLTVVVIPLCLCLLIRRRNIIESTHGRQKPDNPRINHGLSEYTDQSYYQDNGHDTSAIRDEEIQMDRLMNVMSRSSYLQQGLSSRPDFIRPYIVTGTEEFDQDDQHFDDPRDDDGTVGRVAYNPMIYR